MPDTPRLALVEPAGEPSGLGHHEVRFERTRDGSRFRALCSCGWGRVGPGSDEQAIRGMASHHDIDWVDALNVARFPLAHS